MTAYYLSRYVGNGILKNKFRPALSNEEIWSAIDLRPSSASLDGYCLVALPTEILGSLPAGIIKIGGSDNLSALIRAKLGNALGVSITKSKFSDIAAELLIHLGGGPRWKPLVPRRVGNVYRSEIHLGGLLWSRDIPVIAGGASVSDNFDRANSSSLGAQWNEDAFDWSIVSNAATNNATGDAELRYVGTSMATDDQYAESSVTTVGGWFAGVCVRHPASTTRTYYCAGVASTDTRELWKKINGTHTALASNVTGAITFPGTVRVEAQGSTIRGLWNAAQYASATDTSIPSNPHVGLVSYLDSIFYDFSAGDLVVPNKGSFLNLF